MVQAGRGSGGYASGGGDSLAPMAMPAAVLRLYLCPRRFRSARVLVVVVATITTSSLAIATVRVVLVLLVRFI